MVVVRATEQHINGIARLFDLYRQFYACEPDLPLATRYITDRVKNDESVIFVAQADGAVHGFVQLYPTFCSIDAARIFVLYDLYVDEAVRNTGVGTQLMNGATDYARSEKAVRLDLLTEHTNVTGQHLYEKLGYKKTLENYYAYSLPLEYL